MSSFLGTGWELQRLQLRVGEIAAALAVKNVCGSLFSRREYSNLLDVVETHYEIRLHMLPVWLRGVSFTRSCTILGEGMRRIPASNNFDDVNKGKLSGLATFIVLCTRLVENNKGITELLNLLIIGGLGSVVSPKNPHERPNLPYNFNAHLASFVASCIDADSSSNVSDSAKSCITELYAYEDFTWKDSGITTRRRQATIDLMSELFDGPPIDEDEMARLTGKPKKTRMGDNEWARVHNTMHVACANIALAAAANGADVVVQCMKAYESRYFPSLPSEADRKTYFLVRLWCCQPPDDVKGILRYSSQKQTSTWLDGQETHNHGVVEEDDFIVYGGNMEAAIWVSRSLANGCQRLENPREAMLELWNKGMELGKRCQWIVKQQVSKLYPLRFQLVVPAGDQNIKDEALPLSKAIRQIDTKLVPVSIAVANIVHEVYGIVSYVTQLEKEVEPEVLGAAQVVMIAAVVQSLCGIVLSLDDSLCQYAFHLPTFIRGDGSTREKGSIRGFLADALSEGVSAHTLLWTANTIWGGGIHGRQDQPLVQDNVIGIVSQNCTIILDIIRDPVGFLYNGVNGKFISLWRGAACIVPRDPQSGFVRCLTTDSQDRNKVDKSFEPSTIDPGSRLNGRMFLTFEPHVQNATYGTFCYWYTGHLAAEFSPMQVFLNVLRRPVREVLAWDKHMPSPQKVPEEIVTINQMDLLELNRFRNVRDAVVFVNGLDDPRWALFAAGCCPVIETLVHDGNIEDLNFESLKPKLTCGEVIMLIPGCGKGERCLMAPYGANGPYNTPPYNIEHKWKERCE